MENKKNRYWKQMQFAPIRQEGQEKLQSAKVSIVGVGALGSLVSMQLCRAGIGTLHLIDPDRCEMTNLHRQLLYDEEDVKLNRLKTEAACEHLKQSNREICLNVEAVQLTSWNAGELLRDSDVIIDATDNFAARLAINEWCYKRKIPWIYGGVCGSKGMSYNFLQKGEPCFQCLFREESEKRKVEDEGIISMITGVTASIQSAEAVKIILHSPDISKEMKVIDVWKTQYLRYIPVRAPDCPVCGETKG